MKLSPWYLLFSSVDYAGLFPPAALDMRTVVENYASYLKREQHPMLGNLIVPASRLTEFAELAGEFLPRDSDGEHWAISGLVPPADPKDGSGFEEAINEIRRFNKHHSIPANGLALVNKIEVKAPTAEHIHAVAQHHVEIPAAFLEVPLGEQMETLLAEIAGARKPGMDNLRAKIRTGGMTPDLIPSAHDIARFICCCVKNKLRFKATAGLHHPIRGEYRLTYQPDSASAKMHGFVNVFAASVIAASTDATVNQLEEILLIESADEFRFENDQLTVGNFSVVDEKILGARMTGIHSFGSCSYEEPTDEFTSHFGDVIEPGSRENSDTAEQA